MGMGSRSPGSPSHWRPVSLSDPTEESPEVAVPANMSTAADLLRQGAGRYLQQGLRGHATLSPELARCIQLQLDPRGQAGSGRPCDPVPPAACSVLYLSSVETESLTGPQAVAKAASSTLACNPRPPAAPVHFKVSAQGITLTDSQRK